MRGRSIAPWIAIAAIATAPAWLGAYQLALLTYVGLSAIVALGLVVLTGKAGLSSFGQAAIVGVGAYVAAILTTKAGLPPWLTLPACLGVCGLGAWVGGIVMVRLSGHYLSLATIAFGAAMFFLFGGLEITGGQSGLSVPGALFDGAALNYAIVWAALLVMMAMLAMLLNSRMGRAIRALKEHAEMAEAMGVDTNAAKSGVFVIACLMAGLVGWFYAYFQRFVNPSPFSLASGIDYVFMAVLGGAEMLWGAVAGAAIVTLLKPVLQARLPGLIGAVGNFESVVFGAIVILLFQFAPEGLLPRLRDWLGWGGPRVRVISGNPLPSGRRVVTGEVLSVIGASKAFGGLRANDDVGLGVNASEVVALIGPNGAGKSTFFDLVTGVTQADAGEFRLAGHSIAGLSARAIALRGVARSFQHVRLVSGMSALENVAIGAHRRSTRSMLAAMLGLARGEERTCLATALHELERTGLAELAWQDAASLALGQQRILEIARALAADPILLLLDEPAAGLRHHEKQALAALIRGLRADGLAILLVEHDMDFVMTLADRVVVMEFGRVIASGPPRAVQSDRRVQEAYLGAPA
jgi:branched-chain amino acid transport system permease protein